eukprot:TRINITY_DN2836_c0_g1_i22.p1 TRINITY_DN2836_c0_g1~~TRINITY_DN2836_c0_g1_i22.p1  ORF type:complete len:618 (-),score=184.44 TRINITY_DN2836_c0_g1_i22:457-2310(-)
MASPVPGLEQDTGRAGGGKRSSAPTLAAKKKQKLAKDDTRLQSKIANGDIVSKSDVSCPICLCILMEPVEMPCCHVICMPCYEETVTHANICCPVCRTRLSTWARKAKKQNTLVNQVIWQYIKENFREEVESRENGEDITDPDELFPCLPNHQFAEQGEIKSEFEKAMAKEVAERDKLAKQEEEQSKQLIDQLKMEYEQDRRQALEDEELARQVQNTPSPGKENRFFKKKKLVRGPLDSFISSSQTFTPSPDRQTATSFKFSSQQTPSSSQPSSASKTTPKSKTLFGSNNIKAFLKENKVQSSPLSPKVSNSQEPDTARSPAQEGFVEEQQQFESSLLLQLEESPCLTSQAHQSQAMSKASISRSEANSDEESRGEKSKFRAESEDMFGFESESFLDRENNKLWKETEPLEDEEGAVAGLSSAREGAVAGPTGVQEGALAGLRGAREVAMVGPSCAREGAVVGPSFAREGAVAGPNSGREVAVAGPSSSQLQDASLSTQSLRIIKEIGEGDVDESFVEEQLKIAQQIEQEKRDLEIALKLQSQLNKESRSVDRRQGSGNGYQFRNKTPKSVAGSTKKRRRSSGGGSKGTSKEKGKQLSIQESFKKTKLNFEESEEFC